MSKYVAILSSPNIAFYDFDKPVGYELAFQNLINVTDIITELALSGGEVANITINIDNVNGEFTKFIEYWFNSIAEYWQNGVKIFEGKISSIQSSATLQLTVIA